MMVRRTPAEVNAALTDITLVASFARFKASMAVFSEERISFCPFGRLVLVAMVEIKDSWEKAVQRAGCEEESEP